MRMAALAHAGVIFVTTHDSIGLGEDGPTHQPVEHLASFRVMPGIHMMRPGDGNETAGAYEVRPAHHALVRRLVAAQSPRLLLPACRCMLSAASGFLRPQHKLQQIPVDKR